MECTHYCRILTKLEIPEHAFKKKKLQMSGFMKVCPVEGEFFRGYRQTDMT
jgi:hypothetical protein